MLAKVSRVQLQTLLTARNLVALGLLLVVTVAYIGIITPLATIPIAGGYRFPFTTEAGIYALFFTLYFAHFSYRVFRPAMMAQETERSPKWHLYGTVTLRPLFFLVVGGAYVTGAMVASPHLFEIVSIVGSPVVPFAISAHATFGFLIVVIGLILAAFEILSAVNRKQGWRWFVKSRYPEIKALYWVFVIAVIIQGVTGLLLLGALSPWGPFGLIPFMSLNVEQVIRSLHGPLGAVTFAVVLGHIYLRLRPEYRLR